MGDHTKKHCCPKPGILSSRICIPVHFSAWIFAIQKCTKLCSYCQTTKQHIRCTLHVKLHRLLYDWLYECVKLHIRVSQNTWSIARSTWWNGHFWHPIFPFCPTKRSEERGGGEVGRMRRSSRASVGPVVARAEPRHSMCDHLKEIPPKTNTVEEICLSPSLLRSLSSL